jgi:hypothetical protein
LEEYAASIFRIVEKGKSVKYDMDIKNGAPSELIGVRRTV